MYDGLSVLVDIINSSLSCYDADDTMITLRLCRFKRLQDFNRILSGVENDSYLTVSKINVAKSQTLLLLFRHALLLWLNWSRPSNKNSTRYTYITKLIEVSSKVFSLSEFCRFFLLALVSLPSSLNWMTSLQIKQDRLDLSRLCSRVIIIMFWKLFH